MPNKTTEKVEDIFRETDADNKRAVKSRGEKSPITRNNINRQSGLRPVPLSAQPVEQASGRKRMIIVLMIIAVIILIAAVALLLYSRSQESADNANLAGVNQSGTNQAPTNSSSIKVPAVNADVVDSDGDGLTDTEEKNLGTNPKSKDTDNDVLFDREEVKVYQTDPLKADTDGDGTNDGTEVHRGYNPKGSGKLLDLPAAIQNLNK